MKKTCTKCDRSKPIKCFSKHYKNIGSYQSWCKECVAANRRRWKVENREKARTYNALYMKTPQRKAYAREYKKRDSYKIQQKEYRKKNRKALNLYFTERSKVDPNFKMRCRLRTRLYVAMKERKFRKLSNTQNLIGCSFDKLQIYIEAKFESWMSWENYGQWHIDHIIPLHKFDLTKLSEQKKAFNYKNLQPLSASENLAKNGKYQKLG